MNRKRLIKPKRLISKYNKYASTGIIMRTGREKNAVRGGDQYGNAFGGSKECKLVDSGCPQP